MSKKLAISAALSVMAMAGYVVLGDEARAPTASGLSSTLLQAAAPALPKLPALPFLTR